MASARRSGVRPSVGRTSARRASTRRRYASTRSANLPFEARAIMAGHRSTEIARAAHAVNVVLSRTTGVDSSDIAYQAQILPGVSRTFALTIPVLPERLAEVVTNAYLLCRIADTIEDDVGLDNVQKSLFHERFIAVVEGSESAESFAADLTP